MSTTARPTSPAGCAPPTIAVARVCMNAAAAQQASEQANMSGARIIAALSLFARILSTDYQMRCNDGSSNMSSILLTPPASEPVTLADAKAYLRITTSDDDDVIAAFIAGADTPWHPRA